MIDQLHQIFLNSTGVNTDTRTIEKGQLFFALSGENFDGNLYVEEALQQGAIHIVSKDSKWIGNDKVTVVKQVLNCLQQLASFHRQHLNIPIIGLTGSNGKTTTKELIIAVLSTQFTVKGTEGNLNNHIGVPLTLLSFNSSHQIGVVEMGANHPKEIATLCEIAQPNFGLITNYGKAHLEGFGGLEGVKTSKSELYTYLRKSKGTAIIGRWDPEQIVRSTGIPQLYTPENTSLYSETPFITFITEGHLIKTQLTGRYNYHNALFAFTIGKIMEMAPEKIVKGIESYIPSNNRSQIIKIKNTKIILDAYNANPSSMNVAIENLAAQECAHKVAILGDMLELGAYTLIEHQSISELTEELKINDVFLLGEHFSKVVARHATQFRNLDSFCNFYKIHTDKEQVILIKGSRAMGLERLLNNQDWMP
ncbi:UDP-N-acetylmuramoyl-tripeptide--D-alanyl-D-alanine ligase [Nonlabens sp.]|uniref:UDP-N-acetylmuramoyl-tripeptide--D-alanyl-D- alanine ligase n=1 Tax=Nonlabens sp. TaxID=1888209 RepID=UPI0025CFD508|nr:UDP-N-acetylmuramoyl-tripeptide--D-alanyl-D-alanine ligase [Nonlabens sp.]